MKNSHSRHTIVATHPSLESDDFFALEHNSLIQTKPTDGSKIEFKD